MTIPDKDWKEMKAALLEHGKAEISRRVRKMKLEDLVLFSTAELCGKFDAMPRTITEMKIPRIDLTGNGTVWRYSLKAINEHLAKQEVKP